MPGCDVKVGRLKLKSLRTASSALYIRDLAVLVYGKDMLSNQGPTKMWNQSHNYVHNSKLGAIFGEYILFKEKLV